MFTRTYQYDVNLRHWLWKFELLKRIGISDDIIDLYVAFALKIRGRVCKLVAKLHRPIAII